MALNNSTDSATAMRSATVPLLWTSGLLGVFAFFQLYSIQAVLPILMQDLHANVVQVGNAVGAGVLAVALVSPFVGMLSDAVGRKPLIVGAILVTAIPTALIALAGSIQVLTTLRFLQGLGVPGITVVTIAYIGEEFYGRDMTRMVSAYVSGSVLGGFLGRFLFGQLSAWIPWRSAFLVMAILNLVGALLVWRSLPPSRNFVANRQLAAALKSVRGHLCNKALLSACALGMCVLFSLVGCFTYVSIHLAAEPFGLSTAQLANVFAVYLLGVLVTPITGKIMPHLGTRKTVLVALSISSCGLLITLLPTAWGIVLALAIMSSGVFVTQSATISFIAQNVQGGRSLASGLYYMAYYGGGFMGAWICGIAYTYGAWRGTVVALLLAQAIGLAIAGFGMRERRLNQGPSSHFQLNETR
ncbi:MFS transporter [Burkholderia ubonensis]|uniref:MFS transporter n=1 Tax=Burkholderia ubonensis subsp. mesacidophila TaxID=265293 RepID=A0A2A4F4A5_9BURK|nr:MFS transporter [Burkholderia ubonensis]PCE27216.1 MFS transporter [Burkholderia ubonensis subsp. mesacidophila]